VTQVAEAFCDPSPEVPAGLVVAARTHWCLDAPAAAELLRAEESAAHLYG